MTRGSLSFLTITAAMCLAAPLGKAGELHDAAKKGDVEKIKATATRENVNSKDDQGATPLLYASAYGKKDVVEALVAKGADVKATMPDGTGALELAARYGETEVCDILIRSGADLDRPLRNLYDRTAIFLAIMNDHAETAKLLINKGAKLSLKDKSGMVPDTPLSLAAWKEQKEVVKLLLEKGAKDAWLSGVPGFDPLNLVPMTPQRDKNGEVRVGSLPLFLGRGFAKRPWKQPADADRSRTGSNLFRWAHPDREKGPLTIMVYEDERQNQTLVAVVPTIFVGDKGILYSEGQTAVESGGPFVDLVVDTGSADVEKIRIERPKATPTEVTAKKYGELKVTLSSVSDYEPLTITTVSSKAENKNSVDLDCCYRGARKGTVIYTVKAFKGK